jgi:hypothetical protein
MAQGQAPFQYDPAATAIAIEYANDQEAYIADQVLPHIMVDREVYKYQETPIEQRFRNVETRVGRRSSPNQVEFRSREVQGSTRDHALDNPIPNKDVEQEPSSETVPLEDRGIEGVTELLLNDKESAAASVVFDAATYDGSLSETLSGTDRWSNGNNSTPIEDMKLAMDEMILPPNTLVLGKQTATYLQLHPNLSKAYNRNEGAENVVPLQFLADLLGLDQVLVGENRVLTAQDQANAFGGSTPSRAWGPHAALLHITPNADPTGNGNGIPTFGFTPVFQGAATEDLMSGSIDDPDMGMRGGTRQRVGMSYNEEISASELGYYFENAGDDS